MQQNIVNSHARLKSHPMYSRLNSVENIQTFMKYHVFAVWDFMSLLKSLQRKITCVSVPWTQSSYNPELVQLINEIVIGEESDVDQLGNISSHFALYLKAMDEIGADKSLILNFINSLNFNDIPPKLSAITSYHLDLALNADVHEVAASFFYGREKLIPEMFQSVLDVLKSQSLDCPTLIYYLERHIEVDAHEHGPKAMRLLNELLDTDKKRNAAINVAIKSLKKRYDLWDLIHSQMT